MPTQLFRRQRGGDFNLLTAAFFKKIRNPNTEIRNKFEFLMTEIANKSIFYLLINEPFRKFMTLRLLNFVIVSVFVFRVACYVV